MNQDFETILDDCLSRMKAGVSLETCLAEYPEQGELLQPLLQAANQVRSVPSPRARPQAVTAGRERMLAAYQNQNISEINHKQAVSSGSLPRYTQRVAGILRTILVGKETTKMKLAVRIVIDLIVILVIGSGLTVNASARSLPGDPTYGIKRTWEQVRLSLIVDEQARQQLENHLFEERREEIQALMQMGRQEAVEFTGVLESIEGDQWTVGGLAFQMVDSTTIEGVPAIGQFVRILAHVQNNGTLLALHVSMATHHSSMPDHHDQSPAPAVTVTPYPTQSAHTPEQSFDPTHTPGPTHHFEPEHTAVPTHHTEPTHDAGSDHPAEPVHQPESTQHVEPPHEPEPTQHIDPPHEPEPTQHVEPPHDPGSGHPDEPPHDGGDHD